MADLAKAAEMLRAGIPLAVRGQSPAWEGVSCSADFFYWVELNRRGAIIYRPPSRWDCVAAMRRALTRVESGIEACHG